MSEKVSVGVSWMLDGHGDEQEARDASQEFVEVLFVFLPGEKWTCMRISAGGKANEFAIQAEPGTIIGAQDFSRVSTFLTCGEGASITMKSGRSFIVKF